MDFNFRQYDPQLGRFNAVDPLAGSTDMVSPYAAMGNAPESLTDPTGLQPGPSPKISTAGINSVMLGSKEMSDAYVQMLQAVAGMALAGMEIPDHLLSGIGGGNRGNGGSGWSGISGQQYMSEEELDAIWSNITGLNNYVVGGFNIPLSNVAWYDGDFDGMPGIGNDPDGDGKYGISDGNGKGMPPDYVNDIQVRASDYANILQNYYESKNGGTYHLSIWRFNNMVDAAWNKQAIEFQNAKYNSETGIYTVPVNFYKTDYWASFGKATLEYRILDGDFKNPMNKINFIGFHDTWDLDPKSWGIRSFSSEIITRWYNLTLDGRNFKISYP